MAHKITIWNPKTELEELEDKVSKLEVEKKVPLHYLLVPKAALKEAGWDIEKFIKEAIERGRVLAGGGELTEDPSWEAIDDDVLEASEVSGLEAAEEEQRVPGRVFNLLGDMEGEESREEEGVREDGLEDESMKDYNKRMFDEFFGDIKKEEAMETEITKENLADKMAQHLADTRRKVIVGDETGWLCEACNRVWSLNQPFCPNKDCTGEAETDLKVNIRHTTDARHADPDWLRRHMAAVLEVETKSVEEKKEDMAKKVKDALGVETLPGDPEPCTLCGAYDSEECGCCTCCEETEGNCKCCEHCYDYPCICDTTEECPICEARIPIGDACPTGCDADAIELVRLYEEVKNSTELDFVEKARYMALLKEKMKLADDVVDDPDPYDEDEDH